MVFFRCPFGKALYICICLATAILLVYYYASFYWIPKDMTIPEDMKIPEDMEILKDMEIPEDIAMPNDKAINDSSTYTAYWYLKGGNVYPIQPNKSFPLYRNGSGDRILEQLMYVPEQYDGENATPKLILIHSWNNKLGEGGFIHDGSVNFEGCPVSRCIITTNKTMAPSADAIIYKDTYADFNFTRPSQQVWIMFHSEPPPHTGTVPANLFNWTATYRSDSDIVVPYGLWYYYDKNVKFKPVKENYAATKEKKVAWFVSNCNPSNKRREYAAELSKYIQVDVYGKCGTLECTRDKEDDCYKMLAKEYKFYLAFENSNCREYITEKYFINSLDNFLVPIVMGASREEFAKLAPQGSYIHVDDFESPQHLSDYLYVLDNNDTLYNSYFGWHGTGELIARYTFFYCRLCAMLHGPIVPKQYENVNKWWMPSKICG